MTTTDLPPAGWYPDPEEPSSERYWSGAAWSEDRRARPTTPPTTLPAPSAGQPAGDPTGTGASQSPATPTKKHWHLRLPPLEKVVEELHSHDAAARVAAASQLQFYRRRRYAEQRLETEIACLRDPVPGVRYRALEGMLRSAPDRDWLISLLVSDKEADADTKTSVFADITGIGGPDSPHSSKWVKKQVTKTFFPVIAAAQQRATSTVTLLPLLELAQSVGMTPPTLFTPWVDGKVPAFAWPDRCCVCGTPRPGQSKYLAFHHEWTTTQGDSQFISTTMTQTRTVASGGLTVPVCSACEPPAPPDVGMDGLRMKFPSAQFVAALLEGHVWSIRFGLF